MSRTPSIRALWIAAGGGWALAAGALLFARATPWGDAAASAGLALFAAAAAWSAARLARFYRSWSRLTQKLLEGDWTGGIRGEGRDELGRLARRWNLFGEQLAQIDALRASRVRLQQRVALLLLNRFPEPAALFDVESGRIRFNGAARERFGAGADEWTLNRLRAEEGLGALIGALDRCLAGESVGEAPFPGGGQAVLEEVSLPDDGVRAVLIYTREFDKRGPEHTVKEPKPGEAP
jgi:PAS domain-containing protein